MSPLILALPGNQDLAQKLAAARGWPVGELAIRRFPDGETHVRFLCDVARRDLVFVCTLDRPDEKTIALYLAMQIGRELGARRCSLVAPYLAYMRQDARFNPGEGISSAHYARLLSGFCDRMVTVDPHLHRHRDLSEIYSIPTRVVQAAPAIALWISVNVARPYLVGPDGESEQWVAEVAARAGCPYTVLQKKRSGDRQVEVSVPDALALRGHTPVLVDDIASTARTMIAAVNHLHAAALTPPVCIAVHPVFAGDAWNALQASDVAQVVSCNTIAHPSNAIDVSGALAAALDDWG